jgi:hypothetical protein
MDGRSAITAGGKAGCQLCCMVLERGQLQRLFRESQTQEQSIGPRLRLEEEDDVVVAAMVEKKIGVGAE